MEKEYAKGCNDTVDNILYSLKALANQTTEGDPIFDGWVYLDAITILIKSFKK